jgi:sec-independent protein translocase protein TatA
MGEMVVLLLIVVVVFGAGKLPQVGEALGRSVKNFKKAVSSNDEIDVTPKAKALDESPTAKALEDVAGVEKQSQRS